MTVVINISYARSCNKNTSRLKVKELTDITVPMKTFLMMSLKFTSK